MNDTEDFKAVAEAMAAIDFCMMQTVGADGVNTRPMSTNGEVEYDGDSWFFSSAASTKNAEIAADDRVQLTFTHAEGPSFISVWGRGEIVDDVETKRRLWQDELGRWFENGPDDPEVTLIRVRAGKIQTWGRMGDAEMDMTEA